MCSFWETLRILVEIAQNARANSRTELARLINGGLTFTPGSIVYLPLFARVFQESMKLNRA